MATITQSAARGQRRAMETLYNSTKQKVFYIAQSLLANKNQAIEATVWVYKNIWNSIKAAGITTDVEFAQLAVVKTAEYCKKKIAKQDPKAFTLPKGGDFSIKSNQAESIPAQLPPLQRFIFVLHTAGGCSLQQIADVLQLDTASTETSLEAVKTNVAALAGGDYANAADAFRRGEKDAKGSAKVDAQVAAIIDGIAAPAEKKKKTRTILISVIAVLVVALCIVGAVLIIGGTAKVGNYYADIEIQDYGTVTVLLDGSAAPITVQNFVDLAESGFYDGLTFHRIISGFVMQGGDPEGTGLGGSPNKITGEFAANGVDNPILHTRGVISMARGRDYNSASSQFFIVHADNTTLDGKYAAFGHVTEGMEVVDAICADAKPTDKNGTIPAAQQPIITSVTIRPAA